MNNKHPLNKNDLITFIVQNSSIARRSELEPLSIETLVIYKVQLEINLYKKLSLNKNKRNKI